MQLDDQEEKLLRSVALQNARAVLFARERAEREVVEAQERVTRILESIRDGFMALDRDWRITYINRKGGEILSEWRTSSENLLGRHFWQEFPQTEGPVQEHFQRAVGEQVTVEFESCLPPLSRWFVFRGYPSEEGLSVYFHEITARRRADEALRQSEEQLRAMFHQVAIGMATASLDGCFERVNARLCELLHCSQEDLVGRNVVEVTHPEEREQTRNNVRRLREGEIEDYVHEKRFLQKDGGVVWALACVTLLKDSYGQPRGFIGVVQDITERKRAQEAVREVAERFQLALAAGRLGDWSWDPRNDRVTLGSEAARIFGLPADASITWADLRACLHPEDREKARSTVEEALREGVDYDTEYRVLRDGQVAWVAARGRGVYDADGSVRGMIGVVQDITARKAAEESQFRLAAVVQSSDDAIISMTLEAMITTWNKGAERMFGYSEAEVVGKSINMLIPPESEDDEAAIIARLLRGERIDHYETIRKRKDGTLLDVSLSVSPIYDAAQRVIGVSKISRDITLRKRAEAALRRRDEEIRAMADSIPQLAWMAHPDGNIFWYNRVWFEYTGTTLEKMQGWGWRSVHDPEILPKVLERWGESLRTGRDFEMEFPLRGKDGQFRWFLTRVSPMRDEHGRVLRWFGTNTDVDEVRRARLALNEETRLLEILNNTGKAIASELEIEKLVQKVTDSATELTGARFGAFFYTSKNEEGGTFMLYALSGAPREAFDRFGHPRATPLFDPIFKGEGLMRSDDITQDPRYGKWAPHYGMPKGHLPVRSYLAVPVVSRTGAVLGGLFFGHPDTAVFTERSERLVVGMAAQAAIAIDNARLYDSAQREIENRRRVEEELRHAQTQLQRHAENLEHEVADRTARLRETIQELEAFSYSVSHDMRSPLRAMQGYSDALIEDHSAQLSDTARDYLKRIRRAASRMDLLIQDVLAYSRVAKGDIQMREINVEHVLRDILQTYPGLHGNRADITIIPPIPPVLGHEAYVTQIVSNFLTNAVKFVAPGTRPRICISARLDGEIGDMVRISFQDNGIGIAPEHHEQIFKIFGRVYSEKKFEGTGIGLAIVKKAAERMGGGVGVKSELGHGSEFFVVLRKAK